MEASSIVPRFSSEVITSLSSSGWSPSRKALNMKALTQQVDTCPSSLKIVEEFGGLCIGKTGPGIDKAASDIRIIPTLVRDNYGSLLDLGRPMRQKLYPLGDFHDGNAFLACDEAGRIYYFFGDLVPLCATFDRAIELLLKGKKGTPEDTASWNM